MSVSANNTAPSLLSSAKGASEQNTRRSSPSSSRITTRYSSSASTKSKETSALESTSRSLFDDLVEVVDSVKIDLDGLPGGHRPEWQQQRNKTT